MPTNIIRDARIGLRLLWKNPGFTAVAVLTLALGVGATTAIFSVIHATFIEPLPYRDADRLVMVWSRIQGSRNTVAAGTYVEWKRQASVFEDLNAWGGRQVNLSSGESPDRFGPRSRRRGSSGCSGTAIPWRSDDRSSRRKVSRGRIGSSS